MTLIVIALVAWCLLSVPVALVVGRLMRGPSTAVQPGTVVSVPQQAMQHPAAVAA